MRMAAKEGGVDIKRNEGGLGSFVAEQGGVR